MEEFLTIQDLHVSYHTADETVYAVNGLNLSVKKGETLGLVGETGAGKTTTALSILRLLPFKFGSIDKGSILLDGTDLTKVSEKEMRKIRGDKISMIFQDPMTSLNSTIKIGKQIEEVLKIHRKDLGKKEVIERVDTLLKLVGISLERKEDYPHQLSGGMKQRVVIAIALACEPKLLLADEPTTALDVTIQAQVLNMMRELKNKLNTAMILITHDLGVVAETCDKVAVMYAGEIVEYGSLEHIFDETAHPYTKGLFHSLPSLDRKERRLKPIAGLMPDPTRLPEGCKFHPRCPFAEERCRTVNPKAAEISPGHFVNACAVRGRA